jgi:hypothetical protein
MNFFSSLKAWWKSCVAAAPTPGNTAQDAQRLRRPLPPVHFESISAIPKVIPDGDVQANQFYVVAYRNDLYWALFRCPDGCGEVISLPLRASHDPRWTVHSSPSRRPTLKPSVWRNKGCKAHFILEDGRVYWCGDSGVAPSIARPDLYTRR